MMAGWKQVLSVPDFTLKGLDPLQQLLLKSFTYRNSFLINDHMVFCHCIYMRKVDDVGTMYPQKMKVV